MAAVGKQSYKETLTFIQKTADIDPEFRAQVAAYSIEASSQENLTGGWFPLRDVSALRVSRIRMVCLAINVKQVCFTCTVRTEDGRGFWLGEALHRRVNRFDAREAADVAIEKALRSS